MSPQIESHFVGWANIFQRAASPRYGQKHVVALMELDMWSMAIKFLPLMLTSGMWIYQLEAD